MQIFVECKPDTILIETLDVDVMPIHSSGKTRVIKRLIKIMTPAIGVIDEDPGKPYPKSFKEEFVLEKDLNDYGLRVMRHINKPNYLILISPRLEEWILDTCREVSVPPQKYGLPDDADHLHRVINLNVRNLSRLLDDIKVRSQRIKALSMLIKDYQKQHI